MDARTGPASPGQPLPNQQIALLADAMPALIAYFDTDLRYQFVNRTYEAWFGVERSALIGRSTAEFTGTEGFERVLAGLAAALAGKPVSFEATLPYPTGIRTVRADYVPRRDETGAVVGVYALVSDIGTERALQRAEAVISARQGFLLRLNDRLRSLSDPVAIMDTACGSVGRHVGVARVGYNEISPHNTVAVVQRDWTDGRLPALTGEARARGLLGPVAVADLNAGRTLVIEDIDADPRTAGRHRAVELGTRAFLVVPLVKDGRLTATFFLHDPLPRQWSEADVALAEDVAERTWSAVGQARATAALRDSEARHRILATQLQQLNLTLEDRVAQRTRERDRIWSRSRDLMAILTFDGVLKSINPSWSHLLGHHESELLGKRFWPLAHPDDSAAVTDAMEKLRRGEPAPVVVGRLRHADGSWRYFSWIAVPEGDVLYAIGRDITREREAAAALERAEAELRQSQKMQALGQLTGGIAHDFNNLLQSVVGSLDIARNHVHEPRPARLIANALRSAERGTRLTGQLLAFSRTQKIDLKPVAIDDSLRHMREMLERTLGPAIELTYRLEATGAALADATQLEMSVLNLAINARDAMQAGGVLVIATRDMAIEKDADLAPGDYVEISVRDTGTGMTPDVAARAFDPFFTTKQAGRGTGLGLSQVYGITQQAGGRARLSSEPGKGTIVTILLPRAEGEPEPAVIAATAVRSSRPLKVLVIDDDSDVREFMAESLDALGYVPLLAANGASGLARLAADKPDAMIVDFAMPGMNGAEVAQRARQDAPGLPIVFATGYADTDAIEQVRGDAPVLRKPFRLADLAEALQAVTAVMPERG
ncbi:MAG: histidine kinase [Rhodospirillales bacterium]|nr:histidine kinase [Rhodospirillales bacterium]